MHSSWEVTVKTRIRITIITRDGIFKTAVKCRKSLQRSWMKGSNHCAAETCHRIYWHICLILKGPLQTMMPCNLLLSHKALRKDVQIIWECAKLGQCFVLDCFLLNDSKVDRLKQMPICLLFPRLYDETARAKITKYNRLFSTSISQTPSVHTSFNLLKHLTDTSNLMQYFLASTKSSRPWSVLLQ